MSPTLVLLLTIYGCCIQQGFACMATETPGGGTTGPTGPTTLATPETSPVETSTVVTTPLATSPTTASPDTTTTVTADNSKCVQLASEGTWRKGEFKKVINDNIKPAEDSYTKLQPPIAAQFDPKGDSIDKSTLATVDVTPAAGQTAFVRAYEATQGIVLRGCRNNENDCEDISNPDFNLEDQKYKPYELKLKEDTDKVILIGENRGPNIGSIGVTSVGIGKGANPCPP